MIVLSVRKKDREETVYPVLHGIIIHLCARYAIDVTMLNCVFPVIIRDLLLEWPTHNLCMTILSAAYKVGQHRKRIWHIVMLHFAAHRIVG